MALTQVTYPDNEKILVGTSDDLQIWHDGSNSIIKDAGTGGLQFWSNDFRFYNAAGSELLATGVEDSAVSLYYNHSKKFETTADGVQITGDVGLGVAPDNVGSARTLHIKGPSGEPAAIRLQSAGDTADTDDMAIYKTDTNAYLRVNGTDPLRFYMNGADKLIITSTGLVKIENDTGKFTCGAGDDLQLYHDGTDSRINNDTGSLYIDSPSINIRSDGGQEDSIQAIANGAVNLFHNGSKKFETTSTGTDTTGNCKADTFENTASTGGGINPVGTVIWFAGASAPTGYLKANGDTIADGSGTTQSITADFSALFAIVGATLPDLRGEFIRGVDDSRGVDSGRSIRSTQAAANDQHTHTITVAAHNHSATTTVTQDAHAHDASSGSDSHSHSITVDSESHAHDASSANDTHDHSGSSSTDGNHTHTYSHRSGDIDVDDDEDHDAASSNWGTGTTSTSGSHSHTISVGDDTHSHTITVDSESHAHDASSGSDSHSHSITVDSETATSDASTSVANTTATATAANQGSEARPRNVALLACIKY